MKTKTLLLVALPIVLAFTASGCGSEKEERIQETVTENAGDGKIEEIGKETKAETPGPVGKTVGGEKIEESEKETKAETPGPVGKTVGGVTGAAIGAGVGAAIGGLTAPAKGINSALKCVNKTGLPVLCTAAGAINTGASPVQGTVKGAAKGAAIGSGN
jgi:hypothetical protein